MWLRSFGAAALVAAALSGDARAQAPRGEVVEQVIAVVRGPGTPHPRVITLTRLKEEARIALVSRGAASAASAPLDGDTLRATLEWLIDQTLLGDEVARLQVFEVDAVELEAELRRFRERFAQPGEYAAFLARLDLEEEDLAAVLRRTLRVQEYVQSRITGGGGITEKEAQAWIAANPDRVRGLEPSAAQRDARIAVEEERAAQQVKALVAELRSRSDVRMVGDVEGRGS